MSDAYTLRRVRDRQDDLEAKLDRRQGFAPTHDEMRAMADVGRRYEQLFKDLEMSVPEPRGVGESPFRYQLRVLERLQPFCHQFRDAPLVRLVGAGLEPIADEIEREARRAAANPTVGSFRRPGTLREIRRTDQAGNTITEYRGDPLSWMQAFMPAVETTVVGLGDGHQFYHVK